MLVYNDNNNEHKNARDIFREIIADYIIGNIDADELKKFCNTIDSIVDEKEIDEEDKGGIITTDEYNEDDEVCITTIMYNPDSDCSGFQIMYDTDKVTASNYMYMALEKMFTDIFPGFNRNLFAVNVGKAILDSAIVHNTIFGKSIDE